MSFDPRREDYQRLALRYASSLKKGDPSDAARLFSDFGRRYARDRESLPQTAADRAFHLVARAAVAIDYELPFATSEQAPLIVARASRMLDEATSIDENCYDAIRMKEARRASGFESNFQFLNSRADEVLRGCEEQREQVDTSLGEERTTLGRDLAIRPYLRWMAALSEEALICGRNRTAIEVGEKALAIDPSDAAGVRFTMALAYAKLEDQAGFRRFADECYRASRTRMPEDAWFQIARCALAYKRRDFELARERIKGILRVYAGFVTPLIQQTEIPDGIFSRIDAAPFSEDELLLAVSEATVLLQEGHGRDGRGSFGTWVRETTSELSPAAALEAEELSPALPQDPEEGDS